DLEHEAVGIYISGHPYDDYRKYETACAACGIRDLEFWKSGENQPSFIGLLADYREKISKNRGEPFGIMTFEDADASVEAVCYSRQWPNVKPLLVKGEPYLVTGNLKNEGNISVMVDSLEPLSEIQPGRARAVKIEITDEGLPDEFYGEMVSELKKFPGNLTVLLDLRTQDERALLKIRSVKVSGEPSLAERISSLSGGRASLVN
ncbi:MAG: hypothetical protein LBR87_05270, partial [Synergistaceae bacterium]|nr:hypothetical protein [Synergistaceae bacterium]